MDKQKRRQDGLAARSTPGGNAHRAILNRSGRDGLDCSGQHAARTAAGLERHRPGINHTDISMR